MTDVTLYHNPRCSKSRQALQLLQERGINPHIIEYLKHPLNEQELLDLLRKLDLSARELLRKQEPEYKANNLDELALKDSDLLTALAAHPILMERPIAVVNDRAVIGRPPENIISLL